MLRSVLGGIAATIVVAPFVLWLQPAPLFAIVLGSAAYCTGMVAGAVTIR